MTPTGMATSYRWYNAGDEVFRDMLAAIDAATASVRFETYIFKESPLGVSFRDALTNAARRGVHVLALVDALGSLELSTKFWQPFIEAGGTVKWFNPIALKQMWIRNHRKLLVCDELVAFVGGYNVAPEYEGDGVAKGWRDIGMRIAGPLAAQLAPSFDEMFARADLRHRSFARMRKSSARKTVAEKDGRLLFSGPGRGKNPIKAALIPDLAAAREVRIMMAYFLPSWRMRRELMAVARRGGRAQLILAGKSDVLLSQFAGRSLYRRLMQAGVEIYEYEPQVLHAKLIVIDDAVYVGSANLDPRSLQINYELMIRFQNPGLADEAREIFEGALRHCTRIDLATWRSSRTLWRRLKHRLAYWLLARLDPWIARWQWRSLPKQLRP
ncbi:MAG: phosphatidylserine/phosphatidylglycerophosphate/cardiolipin synthase family protein [Verrucomicrobiota bacterium]